MQLTANQRRSVEAEGHTLVSACPGSGKTSVLSFKAAYILNTNPNHKVVAVTFTRDSASELKERIMNEASNTRRRLITGTFHSIALSQIRGSDVFKGKRIISGGEFYSMVNRARNVSDVGDDIPLDDAVEAIESFKSTLRPKIGSDAAGHVYRTYQTIMDRENMVDFSDLLLLSVIGMQNGSIKPIRATHMLIDEAQDMDGVQYEWIKCHAGHAVITLVGDDDQAIYGWRHALGYDGLMRFRTEFQAEHITLADNFRSDRSIVQHADHLVRKNKKRVAKSFNCFSSLPGIVETATQVDEMEQSKTIARIVSDGEQWGILGRTNKILDIVELGLIAGSVPYIRSGGSSLWNRDVIAVYLALLHSIASNSTNGIGTALHWVGVPDYYMGPLRGDADLHTALTDIYELLNADSSQKLVVPFVKKFLLMLPQWRSLLKKDRVNLVCGGVSTWLSSFVSGPQVSMLDMAASILADFNGTLEQRMSFVKGIGKKKKANNKNINIYLMTMHASKGLEFDCVMVASCIEGVTPHLDAPLDEERRLFYVAMTRARHRLVLMHYMEKPDGKTSAEISRFVGESGL